MTDMTICARCKAPTAWAYLDECWWCAKARLADEDQNDMVPVVIADDTRAILEADAPPVTP